MQSLYHAVASFYCYMTPVPIELSNSRSKLSIMSNSNTNTMPSSIRNIRYSTANPSMTHVVYIGKYQQPISLAKMASINSDAWKKSASFGTLADAVEALVEAHSVADVIFLVSSEIPIDTGSSFQESQRTAKLIVNSVLSIDFLDHVVWLKLGGNEVKISDPTDLKLRPVDIQYIRFRCQMHCSSVDAKVIAVPELSFYFCLKLPQFTYDDAYDESTVIVGSTLVQSSCSGVARSFGGCFSTSGATPPSTPTTTNASGTTTGFPLTMTLFLNTQKAGGSTKKRLLW